MFHKKIVLLIMYDDLKIKTDIRISLFDCKLSVIIIINIITIILQGEGVFEQTT